MSRISEALRRASREDVENEASSVQAVFESPWLTLEPDRRKVDTSVSEPVVATSFLEVPSGSAAFSGKWRERLAIPPEGNSVLIEQFRRLAGTVHHAQMSTGLRTLMITSASPGDGKTLTAVNLAIVLSASYQRRVLLVDADLRQPSIGNIADLANGPGLSEALRAKSDERVALVNVTPTLTILPAGQPLLDPIGCLTSLRMRRILEEGAKRFDWVILDAPPVGHLADASLLAEMADGTLLVVRAGRTQYPRVQKAIDALGRERILGVVLNGLGALQEKQYESYYGSDAVGQSSGLAVKKEQ